MSPTSSGSKNKPSQKPTLSKKQTQQWACPNYDYKGTRRWLFCSCLLLIRLVVLRAKGYWRFTLYYGRANRNWLGIFHFPSVSYIIPTLASMPQSLPSTSFQIRYSLIIVSFITNLLRVSSNKSYINILPIKQFWWRSIASFCRSQWPCGLRHDVSLPAQTLGSWVRIQLKAWMSVRVYYVFVVLCVGRDLSTGWSPVQGVLPTVNRIK
jgi:hypothetical protein